MDVNTCFATTDAYRDLALYSHLIPAVATLILGLFAYLRAESRLKAGLFFCFSLVFAAWLIGDLVVWTADSYYLVAALWAPLDLIEISFFLLLFAFVYADLFPETLPRWFNPTLILVAGIPFALTILGQSVLEFNQPQCEMLNNRFLENYKLLVEAAVIFATLILGVARIIATRNNRSEQVRVALIAFSVFLFMGIFGGSEYIANTTYVYEINLYALFSLPIFVLMLTAAIANFGTFKLGEAGVRVLFYVFLLLAGTQFFFVQNVTGFLLASMSFAVVLTLGFLLFRVSEREIHQRELIQKQEQELEVVNKQQEGLLHFISHEIKGYLTKNEAGFSSITSGDYGEVPAPLKTMSESALQDTRKGVDTIMNILDASNLKKGTVTYTNKPFDLCVATQDIVSDLQPSAREKNITMSFNKLAGEKCAIVGDEEKIRRHVIRNIIDNSIKYTPHGEITVGLESLPRAIRLTVSDTGVGITPEDMRHLFTEGGRGTNAVKVNVHSTGYGLYIAKAIVEAHGGKIWAESEGKDKGSRFIVELPVAN